MKNSFKKEDIRKMVRELIKETLVNEGWFDFLKSGRGGNNKIPLATDIEKWYNEYVDSRGIYIGPQIPGFTMPGVKIRKPKEISYYRMKDVEIIYYWNEDLAKQEGYSEQEVDEANKALLNSLSVANRKITWKDIRYKYDNR